MIRSSTTSELLVGRLLILAIGILSDDFVHENI